MNTLEIAEMTGKRHDNVIRDVKRLNLAPQIEGYIVNPNTGKLTKVYELLAPQIEGLVYGKEVIQAVHIEELEKRDKEQFNHIEELEKRDKEQSARIKELEKANKDKDKKINQLEDALLAKTKSLDQTKAELDHKTISFNKLDILFRASRNAIIMKGYQSTIRKLKKESNKAEHFPNMNSADYKTARAAFHTDKTKRKTEDLFIYFDKKYKETRL